MDEGKPCSIRGLSVVDDHTAWVSGSNGYVACTTNGGKSWQWQQVKGFDKSDFRAIEAFSAREAIIMSAGTPAVVLKTLNGGLSWTVNYLNRDEAYFLDAMDFSDRKHGAILGDPIDHHFTILETSDGGLTWANSKSQSAALPGEAAFAASGTCMKMLNKQGDLKFVTGGTCARLFIKHAGSWQVKTLPLAQGQGSTGAFAEAEGAGLSIIVGGDYKNPNRRDSTVCYGKENLYEFQLSGAMPGYQSGVCWLGGINFLSTGTSGSNISIDGGKNWTPVDSGSFNVCKRSKHGKLVLLAGDHGKIELFEMYSPHN